jgi:predicted CoA-binding protein
MMMKASKSKKTVIIGATTNPTRYAFIAADMLSDYHHEIVQVGIKKGDVCDKPILDIFKKPEITDVDTVTLYIGPRHQPEHYEYILKLKPRRVIFNPGTENPEFEKMVEESGAEALEACTLVLLRSGQY